MVKNNKYFISKNIDQNNNSDDESLDRWINWFCEIEGHEFFVDVDEDFIRDSFNLWGIKSQVRNRYDDALEMILSTEIPDSEDLTNQK